MWHMCIGERSDEELVAEFHANGNEQCVRILMERHKAALTGYVMRYRIPVDEQEADEIAMLAFYRVLEQYPQRKKPSTFRSYLYRSARNAKIDSLRHLQSRNKVLVSGDAMAVESVPSPTPSPAKRFEQIELGAAIRQCLEKLTETQRDSLLLSYEGITGDDISALIGRKRGNVGRWVSEARARMRRCLESKGFR